MSSAILYVAIVAIWACVLIPRWLRRDPVRGMVSNADIAVPGEAGLPDTAYSGGLAGYSDGLAADPVGDGAESVGLPADGIDMHRPALAPMTAEESRRRMLKARRRLLIMLVFLEAAAVALAILGLAAAWVIAPPSVMLAGYLLLLREAAHADAERAQREADARAWARTRERARAARRAATAAATAADVAFAGDPAAPTAALAAAPVPADYEGFGPPGRDFAPGLAGKYTPSYTVPDPAEEDYDTYDHTRLRAVGD